MKNVTNSKEQGIMRQTSTVKSTDKSTTSKKRLEIPVPQKAKSSGDFNQKVQEKAYELFLQRNGAPGSAEEDWAKAEQIVRGS